MRKTTFIIIVLFLACKVFSQNNHEINLLVGLPKISEVQLEMIKGEFNQLPQIAKSEFVFSDHLLLIEMDPGRTPYLKYNDIEIILLKYFSPSDIYKKEIDSYKEIRAQYTKVDKLIIK